MINSQLYFKDMAEISTVNFEQAHLMPCPHVQHIQQNLLLRDFLTIFCHQEILGEVLQVQLCLHIIIINTILCYDNHLNHPNLVI